MKRRRKLNVKKLIVFLFTVSIIILLLFGVVKLLSNTYSLIDKKSVEKYLASEINSVDLYDYVSQTDSDLEKTFEKVDTIVRGTVVNTKGDSITEEEQEYVLVNKDGKNYYVLSSNLVDKQEDIVLENLYLISSEKKNSFPP